MTDGGKEDLIAQAYLDRAEAVTAMLYDDRRSPTDEEIIELLNDEYVVIRAEVLDYFISNEARIESLRGYLLERCKIEASPQCIGRLMLIFAKDEFDPSFPACDVEMDAVLVDYLAVWSSIAFALKPGGSYLTALSFTFHPELAISELSENLLLDHVLDGKNFDEARRLILDFNKKK